MRVKDITVPTEYILYVGTQPVQKYDSRTEALKAYDMLRTKFPNRTFSVHAEICHDKVLTELDFMGHTCTKDCSGHKAGYKWSLDHNGAGANTPSQSFNNGTTIAQAKRAARPQGGGKMPQYVSQTPDAIRKREARIQALQKQRTTVGDTSHQSNV